MRSHRLGPCRWVAGTSGTITVHVISMDVPLLLPFEVMRGLGMVLDIPGAKIIWKNFKNKKSSLYSIGNGSRIAIYWLPRLMRPLKGVCPRGENAAIVAFQREGRGIVAALISASAFAPGVARELFFYIHRGAAQWNVPRPPAAAWRN